MFVSSLYIYFTHVAAYKGDFFIIYFVFVKITGTGHGMGKELALQYADLGATLVCVDINKENNDETVGLVNAKKTSKAYAYM